MNRKYLGTILNPVGPDAVEMIPGGALVVSQDGTIAYTGRAEDAPDDPCKTIDYSDFILAPGFVDTHLHAGQARAANVRCGELLPWLNQLIFPMEANYTEAVAAKEAPAFFRNLLATGTTCAGVYVTISKEATDAVFEAADKAGIRAVIGKVMMDQHCPDFLCEDTSASVEASIELCEKWHEAASGRLRYAFTPRFALTCTKELMEHAGKEAQQRGCHIMTHVAENQDEVKRATELFPDNRSYLDVYHQAGMLFPGAIFGHGIYLDDQDWELMAKTGAGIAHCATANFMLESGILDLSAAFAHQVPVGLGTDIGAGGATAICRVAEAAVYGQSARKVFGKPYTSVTAEETFYLMTLGGAASMGLSDRIGSLEKGKEADFVVLDPRPCLPLGEWPDDTNLCELIWALILRFRIGAVAHVFIRGQQAILPS